jgi:hypothetical protein
MELELTGRMKNRLLNYTLRAMDGGHWGASVPVIPEEARLAEKIREAGDVLEITPAEIKMLGRWMDEATRSGKTVLPEDIQTATALAPLMEVYYRRYKESCLRELREFEELLGLFSRIRGDNSLAVVPSAQEPVFADLRSEVKASLSPGKISDDEGFFRRFWKHFRNQSAQKSSETTEPGVSGANFRKRRK